jgi:hypothetical protein
VPNPQDTGFIGLGAVDDDVIAEAPFPRRIDGGPAKIGEGFQQIGCRSSPAAMRLAAAGLSGSM